MRLTIVKSRTDSELMEQPRLKPFDAFGVPLTICTHVSLP